MRRISAKQAAINRSLAILVKAYLETHPQCEYMMDDPDSPGGVVQCPNPSTHVHHIKGRGKHTLDVTTFMAVAECHHPNYIHFQHPAEARQKGYLKT